MSERKVLNKYYPPDFDPSKIPRMKLAKNRQYTVRLMAPFNMRCKTCGEYIYKGKKFNARKEDVENETYLGIRIYRFYIKCTRCLQEISFKTDPKNTDYEIEAGATRNFMALKLAEEQARKEEEEAREEEANNPMKLLENRTQQSRSEIELLESLEELRDLNRRQHAVDYETMLQQYNSVETEKDRLRRQEQEDEEYIQSLKFKKSSSGKKIVAEIIIEIPEAEATEMSVAEGAVKADLATVKTTSVNASDTTTASSFTAKMNLKRKQTLVLVKPKNTLRTNQATITKSNEADNATIVDDSVAANVSSKPSPLNVNATAAATEKRPATNSLSLLAAYSDSSGAESN